MPIQIYNLATYLKSADAGETIQSALEHFVVASHDHTHGVQTVR